MTDDQIMAHVWAHHNCPVRLTVPNAEYPWGPPIPRPRERVEVPADAGNIWRYSCSCRGAGSIRAIAGIDDLSMRLRPAIVELTGRRWALFGPEDQPARDVVVYLGQCQDCGRIYWGLVR